MPVCQQRLSLLSVLIIFVATFCGCSEAQPQRAAITGSVSINKQPVPEGTIKFVPTGDTKGTSAGAEIVDGEFTIPAENGPTYGKYKVEIHWSKKTGKQVEMGSPAPPGTKVDEVIEAISPKYNTETKLEKEINEAEHDFDFSLDS
jgi:hypothetical protein